MGKLSDVKYLSEAVDWMSNAGVLDVFLPVKGSLMSCEIKRKVKSGEKVIQINIEDGAHVLNGVIFEEHLVKLYENAIDKCSSGDDVIVAGSLRFNNPESDEWCREASGWGEEFYDDASSGDIDKLFMDVRYFVPII